MNTDDVNRRFREALAKARNLQEMIEAVEILPMPPEASSTEPEAIYKDLNWDTPEEETGGEQGDARRPVP